MTQMTASERALPSRSRMGPVLAQMRARGLSEPESVRRIEALGRTVTIASAKSMIQVERERPCRPQFLLSGWACMLRQLADGRRQVFDFVLPGEGIGLRFHTASSAPVAIMALTPVETADASEILAPDVLLACPDLALCFERAAEEEERRRLHHIVRLGRMTALERLAHLLLELHGRQLIGGQVHAGRFPMPVNQETMADMLGLSAVHVNRSLQELRRRELAHLGSGYAILRDAETLAALVDYAT